MILSHEVAFEARNDLSQYGDNAHILFALQLRFRIEDIHSVASGSLTDGNNDKKCDIVYIDTDTGYAVIGQGYFCRKQTLPSEAPANKASDLNTAVNWLLTRPIDELPETIKPAATELRKRIEDKTVKYIQIWYVHNLPESRNVNDELTTVEHAASTAISSVYPSSEIKEITALEVGKNVIQEWYEALSVPILVSSEIDVPIKGGHDVSGTNWQAFITAVPASWLHQVYNEFKSDLFSANIRGYLGSTRSEDNINNGIKNTAQNNPDNFLVFNNGITALVHSYERLNLGEDEVLRISGISIVNGAQTTGSIGSLQDVPASEARVMARFVRCESPEIVNDIIEFNNRQNKIEASDYRSNDVVQHRLRLEFSQIPDCVYLGGRRGGHDDIIRRPGNNLVPSGTAGQALAAFHQDPSVAYNNKSDIWTSDQIYTKYFSESTTARHIVFCFSLLKCIDEIKKSMLDLSSSGATLSDSQQKQVDFFRQRGSTFLLVAAIAKCLEVFLDTPVPNSYKVSFGKHINPQTGVNVWQPIVRSCLAFVVKLTASVKSGLRSDNYINSIDEFKSLVEATREGNSVAYNNFKDAVQISA